MTRRRTQPNSTGSSGAVLPQHSSSRDSAGAGAGAAATTGSMKVRAVLAAALVVASGIAALSDNSSADAPPAQTASLTADRWQWAHVDIGLASLALCITVIQRARTGNNKALLAVRDGLTACTEFAAMLGCCVVLGILAGVYITEDGLSGLLHWSIVTAVLSSESAGVIYSSPAGVNSFFTHRCSSVHTVEGRNDCPHVFASMCPSSSPWPHVPLSHHASLVLDWQQPWQMWPRPSLFGSCIGFLLGLLLASRR
ncbi:hypothetical protein PTSG_05143 [Salpingoeca rosetta]|uniref:Uncharacterized protein n=1 Tax=Salpingoeca rosetta (strain ATCC 50818 / BSB-021) TaxID=946362 RepID=F2UAM3_SALR5|nr:uncharacterized protein PTSG_05143 [Salpingoeca rosetta]EGD73439.1 hypothetical protein PTSG_05143 [Salpingoeca rosetta]|eukprot:XP_004993721.1 hypothetical protein PTSG_05143 [Salpingoeca rosetta]